MAGNTTRQSHQESSKPTIEFRPYPGLHGFDLYDRNSRFVKIRQMKLLYYRFLLNFSNCVMTLLLKSMPEFQRIHKMLKDKILGLGI